MELKWLTAFVTLSEYLNFNKAAASMYITQPALSKYIASLEEELGVRLFDRSKRGVALTDAGRAILPQAIQSLKMIDETVCAAKNSISPASQGPVRIAVDQYLDYRDCTSSGLFFSVSTFRRNHPSAKVEISYVSYKEMDEELRDGTIDIGFTIVYANKFKNIEASGLQCMPLFKDKMVMVVPPFVREAFENGVPICKAIGELKLLIMDEDTEFIIERLSSLSAVGLTARRATCSSWNEILMRANLGEGFYLLSEETAKRCASPMQLISLEELGYDEPVFHIALWKAPASPALERFLKIL